VAHFVAFLRGMNLGNRRITNDALRAAFEQIGFTDVVTFRASGNVIFSSSENDEAAVTKAVEDGLREQLGYDVPTFLRSEPELEAMVAFEPFPPREVEASEGKLQVILLLRAPSAAARKKMLALGSDDDRLAFAERELYWLPKGRMSDSELDLGAIDKGIGPTTIRTEGTIEQIAKKLA
jgi:uncharacterized protein (DUF1697 family)